jgi:hypothetical protein
MLLVKVSLLLLTYHLSNLSLAKVSLLTYSVSAEDFEMPGRRSSKRPDIVLPWKAADVEREWEGQLVASASRRLHEITPILHVARTVLPSTQARTCSPLCMHSCRDACMNPNP